MYSPMSSSEEITQRSDGHIINHISDTDKYFHRPYKARVPYPKKCIGSIDAAFYYYGHWRKSEDSVFLMAHGDLWR